MSNLHNSVLNRNTATDTVRARQQNRDANIDSDRIVKQTGDALLQLSIDQHPDNGTTAPPPPAQAPGTAFVPQAEGRDMVPNIEAGPATAQLGNSIKANVAPVNFTIPTFRWTDVPFGLTSPDMIFQAYLDEFLAEFAVTDGPGPEAANHQTPNLAERYQDNSAAATFKFPSDLSLSFPSFEAWLNDPAHPERLNTTNEITPQAGPQFSWSAFFNDLEQPERVAGPPLEADTPTQDLVTGIQGPDRAAQKNLTETEVQVSLNDPARPERTGGPSLGAVDHQTGDLAIDARESSNEPVKYLGGWTVPGGLTESELYEWLRSMMRGSPPQAVKSLHTGTQKLHQAPRYDDVPPGSPQWRAALETIERHYAIRSADADMHLRPFELHRGYSDLVYEVPGLQYHNPQGPTMKTQGHDGGRINDWLSGLSNENPSTQMLDIQLVDQFVMTDVAGSSVSETLQRKRKLEMGEVGGKTADVKLEEATPPAPKRMHQGGADSQVAVPAVSSADVLGNISTAPVAVQPMSAPTTPGSRVRMVRIRCAECKRKHARCDPSHPGAVGVGAQWAFVGLG